MNRYYVISPSGRMRLKAKTDDEAREAFATHWTAEATFICDGERVLMKETRTVLATEKVKAHE